VLSSTSHHSRVRASPTGPGGLGDSRAAAPGGASGAPALLCFFLHKDLSRDGEGSERAFLWDHQVKTLRRGASASHARLRADARLITMFKAFVIAMLVSSAAALAPVRSAVVKTATAAPVALPTAPYFAAAAARTRVPKPAVYGGAVSGALA